MNLKGKDEFELIEAFLDFLFLPGDVVQLRALGTKWKNGSNGGNLSSYYQSGHQTNNFAKLALHASNITGGNIRASADGCYFTINALREGAIHWGAEPDKTVKSPTDDDVTFRRTLFIDCDPVRIQDGKQEKKIAANAEERQHAQNRALVIRDYLRTEGFPEPAILDSGNGFSLFYPCAIRVGDESDKAFEGILHYLAENFDNDHVQVDTSVTNRSRIGRLPETWNRKGAGHEPRPHRKAQIYSLPAERVEVTLEQIQKLAALRKTDAAPKPIQPVEACGEKKILTGWNEEQLRARLDEFFEKFNAHKDNQNNPISIEREYFKDNGKTLYLEFNRCPFNKDHLKSAVSFDVEGDRIGLTGFKCFHNTCDKSNWKYIRELMRELGVSSGNAIEIPSDDEIAKALGCVVIEKEPEVRSRFDDIPSPTRTYDAVPVANSQPENEPDEDGDALRALGIEVSKEETKSGTKYFRIAKCPCCQKRGSFWRSDKNTYGYNCAAKQRSWKDGERLWTSGKEGDPEVLQEKYGEDMLNWIQLKQLAESMPSEFIAQGWLHEGHLSIFAGREKRGKSTAVYDLITAILTGQKWMDKVETKLVPVILMDYENPANYIFESMRRMVTQRGYQAGVEIDETVFNSHFAVLHPDLIRKHCSPVNMSEIIWRIEKMKERSGCSTGLFVIDTASPAFQGLFDDPNWTNSGPQVRQAMEIVQQVARQTGWHVMVVYHQNKSGGGASGSYEWQATADVFITFERDDLTKPEGVISINGRLVNPPAPMKFRLSNGLLQAYDDSPESQQVQDSGLTDGEKMDYVILMSEMPARREDAEKQQDIIKKFTGRIGKNKVIRLLSEAVERRELGCSPGNPKFYWKLDQDTVDFVAAIRDVT